VAAAVVLAFLGGLLVGSFLTVVAHRVPRGESIVGPRSRCPTCGVQIAAYDNVPVVSWLVLRGRSRCCGSRISARYPLTELTVALLFVATTAVLWSDPTQLLLGLVFVSVLVAVSVTDLERRIIPNAILLVGAIAAMAIAAIGDPGSLPVRLAAALGAGGVLFLAALAYPKGMGLGDVKLAATMEQLPASGRSPLGPFWRLAGSSACCSATS
jgi:leader peptidase (prepilin peptidase)/N-methyltransferase